MQTQAIANATTVHIGTIDPVDYEVLLDRLRQHFAAVVGAGTPLFTTDATGLFQAFLAALPSADRQHYTCCVCRHFVERFGGLVVINQDGSARSAMWDPELAPGSFVVPIRAMERLVRRAKVTGVFRSKLPVLGEPVTGPWHHFAVTPPDRLVHRSAVQTAYQAAAEKAEDYRNVCRALSEFPLPLIQEAMRVLQSEALYRSEKVLGAAEWLEKLHRERDAVRGPARDNLTWLAVAQAPAGFCRPRASMIGSLLEDIADGMDFATVKRRFDSKMHPLQYQRPQAAPSAGTVKQAEELVAKLGAAGALRRRLARTDEIQALWRPAPPAAPSAPAGGVFASVRTRESAPASPRLSVPPQTMTWVKFRRTVLDTAERTELLVPDHGNFCAYTTAADPAAPPILQWDREDARNPVALYVYFGGSPASRWGLRGGTWVDVPAVSLRPSAWRDESAFQHFGDGVLFVLAGCRDSRAEALSLFPETLRSEFHGIRAVIEAYSRQNKLEPTEGDVACGYLFGGKATNPRIRVTSRGGQAEYVIDRWE